MVGDPHAGLSPRRSQDLTQGFFTRLSEQYCSVTATSRCMREPTEAIPKKRASLEIGANCCGQPGRPQGYVRQQRLNRWAGGVTESQTQPQPREASTSPCRTTICRMSTVRAKCHPEADLRDALRNCKTRADRGLQYLQGVAIKPRMLEGYGPRMRR